jgi:FimV-like protein
MLALFIKSYYTLILTITISSVTLFSLLTYCLLRRFFQQRNFVDSTKLIAETEIVSEPEDLTSIAGDDLIATQLDLARAYIETNQKQQAVLILQMIMMQGTNDQQEEAKELMNFM